MLRRAAFNVANEIAHDFDLIGIVVCKLDADEFIFDQYHQFKAIEPIEPEIVIEVCFIGNTSHINAEILGNKCAHFVSIEILSGGGLLTWAQAGEHNDAP